MINTKKRREKKKNKLIDMIIDTINNNNDIINDIVNEKLKNIFIKNTAIITYDIKKKNNEIIIEKALDIDESIPENIKEKIMEKLPERVKKDMYVRPSSDEYEEFGDTEYNYQNDIRDNENDIDYNNKIRIKLTPKEMDETIIVQFKEEGYLVNEFSISLNGDIKLKKGDHVLNINSNNANISIKERNFAIFNTNINN